MAGALSTAPGSSWSMLLARGRLAALLLLAALAVPANASLLEQSTGSVVAYQFDGGTHHDAPDSCDRSSPAWSAPVGAVTTGMLVPGDDHSDVYVLDVPADAVGDRISVRVSEAAGTPDVAVAAFLPGCLTDILDPRVQPTPEPSPPAPAAGEQQLAASNLDDPVSCNDNVWTFGLAGLKGPAPSSIHVAWTDGAERTLALGGQHGEYAYYRSTDSLGVLLKGAWVNLPAGWDVRFVVFHGDCDATDGGAVYGEPAQALGALLSFTPVRAGPHLVQVLYSGEPPATSMTLTCHVCIDGLDQVFEKASYRLSVTQADS